MSEHGSSDWPDEEDRTTVEIPYVDTLATVPPAAYREQLLVVSGDEPGREFPIADEVTA